MDNGSFASERVRMFKFHLCMSRGTLVLGTGGFANTELSILAWFNHEFLGCFCTFRGAMSRCL